MQLVQVLFAAIGGLLILLYLKYCARKRKLYKYVDKMPGPGRTWIPGLEGISMALKFIGKGNQEIFEMLLELAKNNETPSKAWFLDKCFIFVDKPEDLKVVFNHPNSLEKSNIQKSIPLPFGLICSDVEVWRPHRKYLSPAFKPSILRSFHPLTNKKSKKLVDQLSKRLNKGEFNVFKSAVACTSEAILETMLGTKRDFISNDDDIFLQQCSRAQKYFGQKMPKLWLHFKPILMMTKYYKLENDLLNGKDGVFRIADAIIEENQYRKAYLQDSDDGLEEDDESDDNETKKILIDYFIENRLNWSLQELRDELNTILFAGFDTSALTIAGAILMLAMHQDVQEKVAAEQREVFQSADEEITEEHLKQLEYLDSVINETLRLFPVLPMQSRHSTGEVELTDFTIPPDCEILIPQFMTHRSKEEWGEDADQFRPERFAPEEFSKVHPYAFAPFAQGPRICLGMRYGQAVMKIVLSYLLRNYKFTTSLKYDEIEYEFDLTIKVKQNYMVKIERRDF